MVALGLPEPVVPRPDGAELRAFASTPSAVPVTVIAELDRHGDAIAVVVRRDGYAARRPER